MDEYIDKAYQLVEKFENEYAATMYVAQQTRKLLDFSHNALTESEAIRWVISGRPESELAEYIKECKPRIRKRKYNLLNDYISLINDKELAECLRESAIQSMKAHKIVASYQNLDDANCTRLRILIKQYWLDYLKNELPDIKL